MIIIKQINNTATLDWKAYEATFIMEITMGVVQEAQVAAVLYAHEHKSSYRHELEELMITLLQIAGWEQIATAEAVA